MGPTLSCGLGARVAKGCVAVSPALSAGLFLLSFLLHSCRLSSEVFFLCLWISAAAIACASSCLIWSAGTFEKPTLGSYAHITPDTISTCGFFYLDFSCIDHTPPSKNVGYDVLFLVMHVLHVFFSTIPRDIIYAHDTRRHLSRRRFTLFSLFFSCSCCSLRVVPHLFFCSCSSSTPNVLDRVLDFCFRSMDHSVQPCSRSVLYCYRCPRVFWPCCVFSPFHDDRTWATTLIWCRRLFQNYSNQLTRLLHFPIRFFEIKKNKLCTNQRTRVR